MLISDELGKEVAMLRGDINRMCLATEEDELSAMRDWAKRRIDRIFDFRQAQINIGEVI